MYRRTYWLARDVSFCNRRVTCPEQLFDLASGATRIRGQVLGIVGFGAFQLNTITSFVFQLNLLMPTVAIPSLHCPDVKNYNDGLTRSGTGCYPYDNSERWRVKTLENMTTLWRWTWSINTLPGTRQDKTIQSLIYLCLSFFGMNRFRLCGSLILNSTSERVYVSWKTFSSFATTRYYDIIVMSSPRVTVESTCKAGLNVNKVINEIWHVSYTTVCHITRFKVKLKVTEVRKLRKWPISKSISSAGMYVIKRLMVNYDISRQYINFLLDRLLIFILIRHHMTFKLMGFLPSANKSCLLRGVNRQSRTGLVYIKSVSK